MHIAITFSNFALNVPHNYHLLRYLLYYVNYFYSVYSMLRSIEQAPVLKQVYSVYSVNLFYLELRRISEAYDCSIQRAVFSICGIYHQPRILQWQYVAGVCSFERLY